MPRTKKSTSRKILLDEKILNQKLNRNLKKLNTEQNNILKQKEQKKKQNSIRRNVRRLNKYLEYPNNLAPHPLIVVKRQIFQQIKNHSVILTNMQRRDVNTKNITDGGVTSYSIKYLGDDIAHLFHEMEAYPQTPLHNIKNNHLLSDYLVILCEAKEKCLLDDPNITFIPQETEEDDYVLLMMYVSNTPTSNLLPKQPIWENKRHLAQLKRYKKSTIQSNNVNHHYGSSGECYSFGLRNAYSRNPFNSITITNYAGDEIKTMQHYQNYIWEKFELVFQSFDQKISGISKYLNISCKSMKFQCKETQLSSFLGNKRNMTNKRSMLSGNINVNARTRDIHCEKDITYTTIHVPNQQENDAFIVFEFQLNIFISLKIQVLQNSSFTYSAYCLAHRQIYTNGVNCINLSTYSTKRLYNNYRLSLKRLKMK